MKIYSLPCDINCVDFENEDILVDMSNLDFPVPDDQKKRSSFIFLRNTGIKANFDFSRCSYEDKKEFLNLYLTEDLEVGIDILSSTWIEILSARDGGGVVLPSILNEEEIQMFLEDNGEFIQEIYQLINSLPIYSLFCFPQNGQMYNTDEFPKTDYDKIKLANFYKLSEYDAFILLIDGTTEPLFYEKLFVKEEYRINQIMNKLPYLNLLSAVLTVDDHGQNEIVDRIQELLVPPEVDKAERKEETTI